MYKIIGSDGKEYGPVSAQDITQWIQEGRANGATKAQPEGATEWKSLNELPEFAAVLGRAVVPPPFSPVPPPVTSPTGTIAVDPKVEAEKIINQGVYFSIGDCIGKGWELVKADFWPIIGVNALILLIMFVANGAYIGLLLNGPLMGGLYYYFLKKIRGQFVTLNDAFAGFSLAFVQLLLVSLISGLLISVGIMLCIIPGIYLAIAWYFVFGLVVDKRMEFWPAMELCRLVINKIWWPVLGFAILLGLINLGGMLLLCVGVFFTFPITMAAAAYAYESIFNRPAQPSI